MDPFSKNDWKKSARKAINQPEKASPGWEIAGWFLVIAILAVILRSCQGK